MGESNKFTLPLVLGALLLAVIGISTVYEDMKAERQHDILVNDVKLAADTLLGNNTVAPAPRSTSVNVRVQGPQQQAGERVYELPQDGHKWYVTVFTSPNWKSVWFENNLVAGFFSNADLVRLKAQVHFSHYTSADPLYQRRFAASIDNKVPAITVQDTFGRVVYKASGSGVPSSADQLAAEIHEKISTVVVSSNVYDAETRKVAAGMVYNEAETAKVGRIFKCFRCKPPQPAPEPPGPGPDINVDVNSQVPAVPDMRPIEPPVEPKEKEGMPLWIVFAVMGVVGVVAVVALVKREAGI